MSADEFLSDSHPVPDYEDEQVYNAAAAHWYQIMILEQEADNDLTEEEFFS